jgi:hypothetical protein
MADLEKVHHRPRQAGSSHLDDVSSSSNPLPDPLDLPAMLPPLRGVESEKSHHEEAPPNGGLNAWLQVLGSFFLFFNSW